MGGSPQFITILHRGGSWKFITILQFWKENGRLYSFFSFELSKKPPFHTCWCGSIISRFVANSEKFRKYSFLKGSAQIITILHRGGYQNLLQYYMGGSSWFITILQWGGGVSRDPKFVLRNIWTAPNTLYHFNNNCLQMYTNTNTNTWLQTQWRAYCKHSVTCFTNTNTNSEGRQRDLVTMVWWTKRAF